MPKMTVRQKREVMLQIIQLLASSPYPLTTNEIAEKIERSWAFTNELLETLKKMRKTVKLSKGKSVYWHIF
ncbi:MAG: hypothetical protein QME59_05110 [Candidatus Hydrothermarchaeota archaeon]|nr:hypothetical protein [Candidatus Hydrothermarchaeota archaeon]